MAHKFDEFDIIKMECSASMLIEHYNKNQTDISTRHIRFENGMIGFAASGIFDNGINTILDTDIPASSLIQYTDPSDTTGFRHFIPDEAAIHDAVITFIEYYEASNS